MQSMIKIVCRTKKKYDTTIKLFGFRSGLAYKMIPAILYYAFALFYIGTGIYGEIRYYRFEPVDVVLDILKYIFFFIMFFSPAIFLSDFKYRDNLPFFKKRDAVASATGLILVWMFCYFMANVNIYCMSDTYKQSQAEYSAYLNEQNTQETESPTAEEITTPEETTDSENITGKKDGSILYAFDKNVVFIREVM